EDGIRVSRVTAVQTCALPIYEAEMVDVDPRWYGRERVNSRSVTRKQLQRHHSCSFLFHRFDATLTFEHMHVGTLATPCLDPERRSEERRVGKDWRYGRARDRA